MSPSRVERVKLTAAYLNTMAGAFFAAGVVAPLVAAVFGLTGPMGGVPTLTLALGVMMFAFASLAAHAAARFVLRGLDP